MYVFFFYLLYVFFFLFVFLLLPRLLSSSTPPCNICINALVGKGCSSSSSSSSSGNSGGSSRNSRRRFSSSVGGSKPQPLVECRSEYEEGQTINKRQGTDNVVFTTPQRQQRGHDGVRASYSTADADIFLLTTTLSLLLLLLSSHPHRLDDVGRGQVDDHGMPHTELQLLQECVFLLLGKVRHMDDREQDILHHEGGIQDVILLFHRLEEILLGILLSLVVVVDADRRRIHINNHSSSSSIIIIRIAFPLRLRLLPFILNFLLVGRRSIITR